MAHAGEDPCVVPWTKAGDWTPGTLPALSVAPPSAVAQLAFNDLVVVRATAGQVAVIVHVDGVLYGAFAGDGVIASTQLGSSAYALAAGGPLLLAGAQAYLVTPLAAHGGSLPPVVLGAKSRLRIEVDAGTWEPASSSTARRPTWAASHWSSSSWPIRPRSCTSATRSPTYPASGVGGSCSTARACTSARRACRPPAPLPKPERRHARPGHGREGSDRHRGGSRSLRGTPALGKLFLADAATIAPLYERRPDFLGLFERLDPRGAFRNSWLKKHVVGD
jgi:hypothetical protein